MSRLSCGGENHPRCTRAARVARASPVAPRAPRPRSARSGDRREDARRTPPRSSLFPADAGRDRGHGGRDRNRVRNRHARDIAPRRVRVRADDATARERDDEEATRGRRSAVAAGARVAAVWGPTETTTQDEDRYLPCRAAAPSSDMGTKKSMPPPPAGRRPAVT